MGYFTRECRAPRSQDRGRRDNYRQGSKVEEQTPKAMMAINGVGWDWSFMANEQEDHALVADEEAPTEFALMAKTSAESEVFDNSLCSKNYKKNTESLNSKITDLTDKLCDSKNMMFHYKAGLLQVEELLKKEKGELDTKLTGFQTASKNLDNLLESQRSDKNKEGLGYSAVSPPPAQVYSPPKKDMSWTDLPEFVDDTITDYSRPSPTVESKSDDLQNRNPSVTETEPLTSTILSKPEIKFVRPADSPTIVKTDKKETVRKPFVKYAELYRKPTKRSNVRGNQRNWNNLKSQQLGNNFVIKKACYNRGVLRSQAGWKTMHFKGMTLEEIKEKFDLVWKQMQDFIPIGSKEEGERFKRKSLNLEKEGAKKVKIKEEVPEEKLKEMMQLIPVEEHFDREDLTQLWGLVKETLSIKPATSDKENELWVELKRLFEPDVKDYLWAHTQNLMHAPLEWMLYDTCGVHHVLTKDQDIFMLIDKDYPLRKGPAIGMISYKFEDFPLPEQLPTAYEDKFPLLIHSDAIVKKIALLLKSRNNCQTPCPIKGVLRSYLKEHRHNLVRGLPTKCFENDHNCTASLKGKQHKASCKTKLMNSVTKPLHTLHMDLFCPTSVSSLNHKWYCLVVTDDFSRFTWTFFLKTKDETSGILRNFITEIENVKELRVKIIRCDNRGEFRNKEMNDFCSRKGIKREFSNARTPQQNKVVERRNKTLIKAARTMLADAKLPVTFWAEAVNTTCYVQNKVLVNKSQNKTPYELFNGRSPAIGFLKPFGCHVMILNTLDNLGKFEAKGDEGYFIGYSMSSKALRIFNKRTKRVEENLHVDFLENKLIKKGAGPNWLFNIDSLTNSMNYVPVVIVGTNSTNFSGTKEAVGQDVKKDASSLRYIVLPNWFHEAHLESSTSNAQDTCSADAPESSGNSNPIATSTNPPANHMKTLAVETPIPTVSSLVLIACLNDSLEPSNILRVTTNTYDTNGVEADLGNIETTITASPTPTLRIHKDHLESQIIGHVDTPIQTKNKSKEMEEQSLIATIHQKINPAFLQFCLFSCFLSQEEPKKIFNALQDLSWGLKNKKDERGVVIRNKAKLVAQGHTQEEWIDYDEVFAPVVRIKAIRLFLAYASFMRFTVYQMDVKSASLYGTIDEEVYVMQPPGF
nr:hypothetical protein [Tanacetum cinerariifolium]